MHWWVVMVKKKLTSHKRPLIQTPKFSQSNNLSQLPKKTADIWLRYHWFPRQQTTSECRNSILVTCHYQIWVVLLIGWIKFPTWYNQSISFEGGPNRDKGHIWERVWGGRGGISFRYDDGISSPRTKIQSGKAQIQDILDMESSDIRHCTCAMLEPTKLWSHWCWELVT